MENNNEEFDLDKELMEIRVRNIQIQRMKRQELEEKLRHYKLQRIKQNAIAIGLLSAITIAGGAAAYSRSHVNIKPTTPVVTEADGRIQLTRTYTIQFGDTLSGLSNKTGIPISQIKEDNDIDNPNRIYMNQNIVLNYRVDLEDIEYYTQKVDMAGKSYSEIADEYNTTINTLIEINAEGVKDDTILVPKFISPSELEELKTHHRK